MADFEIRIGTTPDDIMRRNIGISPPLPENVINRIHEDPASCGLPYIRFGRITPSESSPYSEATIWCNGQTEKWNDNEAFVIALAIKGLLQFSNRGSNITIEKEVTREQRDTRFLFENPDNHLEVQDKFLRLAS